VVISALAHQVWAYEDNLLLVYALVAGLEGMLMVIRLR